MAAELQRIGISARAPLSTAMFSQLWSRFVSEGSISITGRDARLMLTLLTEAMKVDIDPKRQRLIDRVTLREGSATRLTKDQILSLLQALSLMPDGLKLSGSLSSLASSAAKANSIEETEGIKDIYGVIKRKQERPVSARLPVLEAMPAEILGVKASSSKRESSRGSQRSEKEENVAQGAPFSTTQDFIALASSLVLTLPADRHSYISLFDHSHLAVLSWAVSEAYNDAALHLGAVIYTFESKLHPVHFAFVEQYRLLSEAILDQFALKLKAILPPDLQMAEAFRVLASPIEFLSSVGCRAPIAQPLKWRASFTHALHRAFTSYCDARHSSIDSGEITAGRKPLERTDALAELHECEQTHLATLLTYWGKVTDAALLGAALRTELSSRRVKLQNLIAVEFSMRLSAISGLSSHAPLFIAIATDLAALSSRLPPPCFFKQLLPDIVKSIAATLRSVLLGVQSSLLSLDGQVGARESLDQALASFNELTEKSGDAGLKDWIRSQLPYRFCSLLCSPSDALVRLHGHRDGAADAEDIVAILRARTGDDEAQKFMQGYAAVSQPRNFEHIQHAGTAAEMEALLTNALPIFGVPLSEAISRRPSSVRGVPELVSTCAAIIRKTIVPNEANHELFYVFREAPDNYRVSKLIKLLDQGKPVDWAAVPIRDVTGIMRRYLSSLPHSLIPSNLYERCLEASASVAAIKAILQDCPAENVTTLVFVAILLEEMSCSFDLGLIAVLFRPVFIRTTVESPQSVAKDRAALERFAQALIMCAKELQ